MYMYTVHHALGVVQVVWNLLVLVTRQVEQKPNKKLEYSLFFLGTGAQSRLVEILYSSATLFNLYYYLTLTKRL